MNVIYDLVTVEFHCAASRVSYIGATRALQNFLYGHSLVYDPDQRLNIRVTRKSETSIGFVKKAKLPKCMWEEISCNVVRAMDLWAKGTGQSVLVFADLARESSTPKESDK